MRLDPDGLLRRLPLTSAEDTEVDTTAARVREQNRIVGRGELVERLERLACSGAARLLSRVFVGLRRPFAYARRT